MTVKTPPRADVVKPARTRTLHKASRTGRLTAVVESAAESLVREAGLHRVVVRKGADLYVHLKDGKNQIYEITPLTARGLRHRPEPMRATVVDLQEAIAVARGEHQPATLAEVQHRCIEEEGYDPVHMYEALQSKPLPTTAEREAGRKWAKKVLKDATTAPFLDKYRLALP